MSSATGNQDVRVSVVDFESNDSIKRFSKVFDQEFDRLDVLVNNAAIAPQKRQVSHKGIEMQWQVNVIGYYLMMTELHPILARTPQSRIVNVSAELAGGLDFSDLNFL